MKLSYKATKISCYAGIANQAVIVNFAPLLFVVFARNFGLTMSQLASIITVNFVAQIIVDVLGVKYISKIGYRKILVSSQITSAIGFILMGILPFIMDPYWGIIIATICYAIGSGLTEVILSPVIEALPGEGKVSSMTFLHSFYCWGHLYTVLFATLYFNIFGVENWRYLSFYWALLPIITAFVFMKAPIVTLDEKVKEKTRLRDIFSSLTFWIFMILMVSSGAGEQSMAQWASMFAQESLKVSKNVGDILGPSIFALTMAISRILYGKIGEKMGIEKSLILYAGLGIFSFLTATVFKNPYINLLGCGICGFSLGVMWPVVLSFGAKKFPAGGTAIFALFSVAGDIGCSFGPELVARVTEITTFKTGLMSGAIFPATILILTSILLIKRKNRI